MNPNPNPKTPKALILIEYNYRPAPAQHLRTLLSLYFRPTPAYLSDPLRRTPPRTVPPCPIMNNFGKNCGINGQYTLEIKNWFGSEASKNRSPHTRLIKNLPKYLSFGQKYQNFRARFGARIFYFLIWLITTKFIKQITIPTPMIIIIQEKTMNFMLKYTEIVEKST